MINMDSLCLFEFLNSISSKLSKNLPFRIAEWQNGQMCLCPPSLYLSDIQGESDHPIQNWWLHKSKESHIQEYTREGLDVPALLFGGALERSKIRTGMGQKGRIRNRKSMATPPLPPSDPCASMATDSNTFKSSHWNPLKNTFHWRLVGSCNGFGCLRTKPSYWRVMLPSPWYPNQSLPINTPHTHSSLQWPSHSK